MSEEMREWMSEINGRVRVLENKVKNELDKELGYTRELGRKLERCKEVIRKKDRKREELGRKVEEMRRQAVEDKGNK